MFEIRELRKGKHAGFYLVIFDVLESRLLNWNEFGKTIAAVTNRFVRNHLHMLVHYTCSTIESRIEKHKRVH